MITFLRLVYSISKHATNLFSNSTSFRQLVMTLEDTEKHHSTNLYVILAGGVILTTGACVHFSRSKIMLENAETF